MRHKALALFSGGLDSILSAKLMQKQGIEVQAITFSSPFFGTDGGKSAGQTAAHYGIPHLVIELGGEYLDLLRTPQHGYGSAINPCVDCKGYLIRRAAALMPELNADFVITGEVLGQRPMSQRLDTLRLIQRECGVGDLLLRPLSARLLPPTLPEREGWVDRDRLPAIKGRSRKPQMALAAEFGIDDYPTPAGGCLLTERSYAPKVRDLFDKSPVLIPRDFHLLRTGRHFRLSPECKLIMGRNEADNEVLEQALTTEETLLRWRDGMGPAGIILGKHDETALLTAARLLLRYTKADRGGKCAVLCVTGGRVVTSLVANDMDESDVAGWRL